MQTFPRSDFYDLEELLTQLGIGEAAVTILSESGCRRPSSTRGCGRPARAWGRPTTSTARPRRHRCGRSTGRASTTRAPGSCWRAARAAAARKRRPRRPTRQKGAARPPRSGVGAIGDFLKLERAALIQREVVRGVFGLLKKKGL